MFSYGYRNTRGSLGELEIENISPRVLIRYRNTRGSLGELEIAWKHFSCTILVQSLKSEEKLVGRGLFYGQVS